MTEFFACPTCGQPADPADDGVIAVRWQILNDSMAGDDGYIDGEGRNFHAGCYPGDRPGRWRQVDKPDQG